MKEAFHPLSFGVAMLIAFLHWMISPPDRTWLGLALHFGTDAGVGASMVVVADLLSCGGSRLAYFKAPTGLRRAWFHVHEQVREGETLHVLLSRIVAFVAACVAFSVAGSQEWDPRVALAVLTVSFVASQAAVLWSMRPRAQQLLAQALEAQRGGLPAGRYDALRALFSAEAER